MEISSPSVRFSATDSRHSPASPITADLLLDKRIEIAKWHQLPSPGRSSWSLRGRGGSLHRNYRTMTMRSNALVVCSQRREAAVVAARCMDEVYDALAERLISNAVVATSVQSKYIVGLAGPPGSGKSTVASEVVRRVNKLWPRMPSLFDSQVSPPDVAIILPMDGFHLYRCQLDAMEGSVYAPSFDHGVGDPVEDDIFVSLQHKVVVVEGNYLFLDDGDWVEASSLFDEKWFIDVDIDKAMQRVLKRHILTGKPPEIAQRRVENNDRPNTELIMKSKKNADLIVRSIDFEM